MLAMLPPALLAKKTLRHRKLVVPHMRFVSKTGHLGEKLAAIKYEEFWSHEGEEIVRVFYSLTGLRFWYKSITVHIVQGDYSSEAGSRYKRMRLRHNSYNLDDRRQLVAHELAHRLLMGNYIDGAGPAHLFYSHYYIYLFLYDAWVQLWGREFAAEMAKKEEAKPRAYNLAWRRAMALTFEQRQEALKRLISRVPSRYIS